MMALVPRSSVTRSSRAGAAAFVGSKARRRPENGGPRRQTFERHAAVALEALQSGDWSGASALTYVALYEHFFQSVYGADPMLTTKDRRFASFRASATLREQFDDDLGAMAAFVIWTWKREREREQYRREHKQAGQVIGNALQFSAKLAVEYRIQSARVAP